MSASTQPLPDLSDTPKFEKPPVIETALCVQFQPLMDMRITHFGRFQERLKGFDKVQEVGRLARQVEQKTQDLPTFSFSLNLSANPSVELPRVWFLSEESAEGQQLIQLQSDKLVQNWRRKSPDKFSYTSYKSNRKGFEHTYSEFTDFAKVEHLGQLVADQCEVSYINHIPIEDPETPAEAFQSCFEKVFLSDPLKKFSASPEGLGFNLSYWMEDLKGRLFIQAAVVINRETNRPLINLSIIARGAPSGGNLPEVLEWLDLGHYYVVNSFAEITSPKMHDKWELKK